MDPAARLRRRILLARRLRDVPPERTMQMGFELAEFARSLGEAGDRVRH